MHIFGDILIVLQDKRELFGSVLVSDVFDVNDCLKTSLVIEFDEKYNIDKFLTHEDIDYVVVNLDFANTFFYGYFKVEILGDKIDKELNDIDIEEDYLHGNISRFHIRIKSLDSLMILDRDFRLVNCSDVSNTHLKNIFDNKIKRREELNSLN